MTLSCVLGYITHQISPKKGREFLYLASVLGTAAHKLHYFPITLLAWSFFLPLTHKEMQA
jgi:hypothetical protein